MHLLPVQLCCLLIVAAYLALRLRLDPEPRCVLRRFALVAAASFLAEDSAMHLYGFYQYSPGWLGFIDRMPVAITLIWPAVIDSAMLVAARLAADRRRRFLLVGALVLADASLIEPIAVHVGLWSWNEPGLFGVPPIGVLGWAFFAGACAWCFDRAESSSRAVVERAVLLAPLVSHALLLATWWGALRWVNHEVPSTWAVEGAWLVGVGLALVGWTHRVRERMSPRELLPRVPPALFFFALLALHDGADARALWVYALAFAPPWLVLLPRLRPQVVEAVR